MAVYQRKFVLNNRSNTEFGLTVCAIEPDNGEVDSYLTMESIYTENFDGSKRYDYGAKYKETTVLYITMVKNSYSDFSQKELRTILDWLTGLRKASWLDLYNDETKEKSFSVFGRVTDVKLEKMDARIIGLKVEFTSVSPWAYSDINRTEVALNGKMQLISICNDSDECGVYVYPNVTFTNSASQGTLKIINYDTGEETYLKNLSANEVITMDSNHIIYSDQPLKIFGDDFNFTWLRFAQGYNRLGIVGDGYLTIEHRNIMKVADAFDDNPDMNIDQSTYNMILRTVIELAPEGWHEVSVLPGDIATYTQDVYLDHITEYSKVNLQANEQQTLDLQESDIEIQIMNDDGKLIAYAYGGIPDTTYTIQATVEETNVAIDKKTYPIILYANCWSGQGDIYTQDIYMRGLTENSLIDLDLTEEQIDFLSDSETTLMIKNEQGKAVAYALGFKPHVDYATTAVVTETTIHPYLANKATSF